MYICMYMRNERYASLYIYIYMVYVHTHIPSVSIGPQTENYRAPANHVGILQHMISWTLETKGEILMFVLYYLIPY